MERTSQRRSPSLLMCVVVAVVRALSCALCVVKRGALDAEEKYLPLEDIFLHRRSNLIRVFIV